jgi:hypothetical protein
MQNIYHNFNGYGHNAEITAWFCCDSMHCTCQADALPIHRNILPLEWTAINASATIYSAWKRKEYYSFCEIDYAV